jgi:predicted nucleic acid-binding protein
MTDVALDANVIVALLYDADVHRKRAVDLIDRLEREGHAVVLLDVLVFEATSVLCRRARERKTAPPDLVKALDAVAEWFDRGYVRSVAELLPSRADELLDVVRQTAGALNVNDAAVVVLARHGVIDAIATFDPGFDAIEDLERFV